jgi:hypothetical protein
VGPVNPLVIELHERRGTAFVYVITLLVPVEIPGRYAVIDTFLGKKCHRPKRPTAKEGEATRSG